MLINHNGQEYDIELGRVSFWIIEEPNVEIKSCKRFGIEVTKEEKKEIQETVNAILKQEIEDQRRGYAQG